MLNSYDTANAVMIAQPLWLPAVDLYNVVLV